MRDIVIKEKTSYKFNAKLFGLWCGIAAIIMFFGALTSAYIVKNGASNWLNISIPNSFYISTVLIVLSSITLHIARNSYNAGNFKHYNIYLYGTLLLALLFVANQVAGWTTMYNAGVDLKTNVAGSFFYLITGMHAAHIIGGIAALIATVANTFVLKNKVIESRSVKIEMLLHYWHFMGFLWIYLLGFLHFIK
jgi:cytochrome c oxidase subunit III